MKENKTTVFYHLAMCPPALGETSESRSPLKPKLLLEFMEKQGLADYLELRNDFVPFSNDEFYTAYINNSTQLFFMKKQLPYAPLDRCVVYLVSLGSD